MCFLTESSSLWGYWNALIEILSFRSLHWDGLTEFLSGCSTRSRSGQRQSPTAGLVCPLALAARSPFSSSFFSAVEVGPSPLNFQHSLSVRLLPLKENLASPGHTKPQGSGHCRVHPGGEESGAPSSKVTLTFQDVHFAFSSTLGQGGTYRGQLSPSPHRDF